MSTAAWKPKLGKYEKKLCHCYSEESDVVDSPV